MKTRAFLYFLLGVLVLAVLLVADLISHSYQSIQGPVFELGRAAFQAVALILFARGALRLFFPTSAVVRQGDMQSRPERPVYLMRRFSFLLLSAGALAFLPYLIPLSLSKYHPKTFPTVISVDLIGLFWLLTLVALVINFRDLIFFYQPTHNTRRRFWGWATGIACFSFLSFLFEEQIIQRGILTIVAFSAMGLIVIGSSVLLGYRLAWLPRLTREEKRKLARFSLFNVGLSILGFFLYAGNFLPQYLFEYYALYWQSFMAVFYIALAIYFALVFFSALFSFSSTELLERKTAEVQSLARLTRFSSDILSSELLLDIPKLADQITTLACEATESDCAWLELDSNSFSLSQDSPAIIHSYVRISAERAEEVMSGSDGFSDALNDIDSPREELALSAKPFVLRAHLGRGGAIASLNPGAPLRALVAVPLLRRDEVRGGLYLGKQSESGYDEDDLTVLTAFSDVASLALETARLLEDSIEKQKFDGELRAARLMQRSLLPDRFPTIPGFDIYAISIPAYDVGGDYYDFSNLKDGAPVIAIGDVSGKGISASLYMAETKGVVQALAPLMTTIPELLASTNSALLRNSPGIASFRRSFVTLGMLTFQGSELKYSRAGHTPLLHVGRDGSYRFIQPSGMAVGLMQQSLFMRTLEEVVLQPAAGDTFVVFSDGITDARNPQGIDMGYEALARFVASQSVGTATAREICQKIIEFVSEFTETSILGDDATLVVVKCNL